MFIRLIVAAVLMVAPIGIFLLTAAPAGAATPVRSDPWICNDYHSHFNCKGGKYLEKAGPDGHRGIDFGADAGTEVISATHGKVVKKSFDECVGHQITIETDMTGRSGQYYGRVYAIYAHTEPIKGLEISQSVKPGDLIGRVIPLRKTECYGSREHVHYELRVTQTYGRDINPHEFWADGPNKVTCFREGMVVPAGKAVAPVRCKGARKE